MVEYIDKFVFVGIDVFKIEGRMKSSFYVVIVVSVYRKVIDKFIKDFEYFELEF